MSLTRKDAKTAKTGNPTKWRSLDPVLVLVSLALSAFGILAIYVVGTDTQQTYAINQCSASSSDSPVPSHWRI